MDRHLTGIGDGCDSCLVAPRMWNDLDVIEEGFPKDRTLETLRETFSTLRRNAKGEIVRVVGDYEQRQGITGEVVTLRETFSFTVTHKVTILLKLSSPLKRFQS